MTIPDLGLDPPTSWPLTFAYAIGWCALMLAYTPVADAIASRLVAQQPNLRAFRALQQSRLKLIIGLIIAWALGGFLEEVLLRGILLRAVEVALADRLSGGGAATAGILAAALVAGLLHLYQGPRAAIIIAQLSVLFGALYVITGYNLWAVILCHGFYNTVAFIRFANRSSKYSNLDDLKV